MEFGPLISGVDVQDAMMEHMRLWMPTYLAELNRRNDLDMPSPRLISPGGSSLDAFSTDSLPAIVVMVPVLLERPRRDGFIYSARWACAVGAVVSAKDKASTDRLSGHYVTAMRASVLQHQSLGGFAESTSWEDEGYAELSFPDTETITAGRVVFGVSVSSVMKVTNGPAVPTTEPLPPDTVADRVIISVKGSLADA